MRPLLGCGRCPLLLGCATTFGKRTVFPRADLVLSHELHRDGERQYFPRSGSQIKSTWRYECDGTNKIAGIWFKVHTPPALTTKTSF
jgi:hypothetical protein